MTNNKFQGKELYTILKDVLELCGLAEIIAKQQFENVLNVGRLNVIDFIDLIRCSM